MPWKLIGLGAAGVVLVTGVTYQIVTQNNSLRQSRLDRQALTEGLSKTQKELDNLKNQDQYKRNQELQATISAMEKTYDQAVTIFERMQELKPSADLNKLFAEALSYLSKRNYASASATLTDLNGKIDSLNTTNQPSTVGVAPSNTPPNSGYQRQLVHADIGDYLVDIATANLSSAKVIVDTASDGTCKDNCPVLPLATYVSRTGAFAAVNGSYFCPTAYPSCAGKTNSFDTLLMNYKKTYFNSDNNIYSTVPAVIFGSGWVRFVGRSSDWGRDTSIDSMIAMQPLLLSGGNIVFGGNSDPKEGAKGTRAFVGAQGGGIVYIGIVHNVTVAEMAHVLKALGMSDALNLDDGGSAAMWFGGYVVGPGRDIPNAVLFVRK